MTKGFKKKDLGKGIGSYIKYSRILKNKGLANLGHNEGLYKVIRRM